MGWLFRLPRGGNVGKIERKVSVMSDVPNALPRDVYFVLDKNQTFPTTSDYIKEGVKEGFLTYSHTARRTVYSKQEMHHYYLFIE